MTIKTVTEASLVSIKDNLEVVPVSNIEEVLAHALVKKGKSSAVKKK